jgi:ribosome-associated translation inhibitor RaiA
MFIQFHSDNHISATDEMTAPLSDNIHKALERYSHQLTSIQVHLSDENAKKSGTKDKRCLMEARLDGMDPIAVTSYAATVEQAVKAAIDKMKISLETRRDRLRNY